MNWIAIGLFFKILFMKAPHGDDGKLVKEKIRVQKVGRLPSVINESSGIAYDSSRCVFYSINDSGGRATVYVTDTFFRLIDSIPLNTVRNTDWEELIYRKDTLVIGDFGNNKNVRRDLVIHEVAIKEGGVTTFPYHYNNQVKFPPDTLDFDCEAFGCVEGTYYLISKNRSENNAHMYKLDKVNSIAIKQVDLPIKGMVTAAAVYKQNDSLYKWVIVTYGILYFLEQVNLQYETIWNLYSYKKLGFTGQIEAIVWVKNNKFILTNERGKIWKLYLKN